MSLRKMVEQEVSKYSEIEVTDEIFKIAAEAADSDIRFHKIGFGKRTSIEYVVYIITTMVIIANREKHKPEM